MFKKNIVHMMKHLAYKKSTKDEASCLFELLLGTKLVGTATLLLTTVGSTRRETSITLTTDHLVTVVLGSQSLKRGLNDTTTKTEDQVKGRFLLDVVITQRTTIFELLTGEDKTLLIRGDTYKEITCKYLGFLGARKPRKTSR